MVRVRVGVKYATSIEGLKLGIMATQLPHSSPSATHSWSVQPPCTQWGNTPLLSASRSGHRDLAELLLSNKADPNHQNNVTRVEGREVAPMVVGADSCIVGI